MRGFGELKIDFFSKGLQHAILSMNTTKSTDKLISDLTVALNSSGTEPSDAVSKITKDNPIEIIPRNTLAAV